MDRKVLKEDYRSFQGGMQENQELEIKKSNISSEKLPKRNKEVLEVEEKVMKVVVMKF